jgi:hypothetical protein
MKPGPGVISADFGFIAMPNTSRHFVRFCVKRRNWGNLRLADERLWTPSMPESTGLMRRSQAAGVRSRCGI